MSSRRIRGGTGDHAEAIAVLRCGIEEDMQAAAVDERDLGEVKQDDLGVIRKLGAEMVTQPRAAEQVQLAGNADPHRRSRALVGDPQAVASHWSITAALAGPAVRDSVSVHSGAGLAGEGRPRVAARVASGAMLGRRWNSGSRQHDESAVGASTIIHPWLLLLAVDECRVSNTADRRAGTGSPTLDRRVVFRPIQRMGDGNRR